MLLLFLGLASCLVLGFNIMEETWFQISIGKKFLVSKENVTFVGQDLLNICCAFLRVVVLLMYICVHMHMCMCVFVWLRHVDVCVCVFEVYKCYMHMHVHSQVRACMCVCVHTSQWATVCLPVVKRWDLTVPDLDQFALKEWFCLDIQLPSQSLFPCCWKTTATPFSLTSHTVTKIFVLHELISLYL